ncbi:V-type ATP synthase subunit I [Endozoicomonas sp. 8E]|uniref:V-type ATP synthase subunit I n=1 Tax=Endozoicomonas sp. 8E TaxID=3035692 RepID=UPI00293950CF|nr:V-type ATP synthase subunit I [Endozoicomonas sp. 8E]WOG29632.1 V-type ATP synthase subunit I [Endozoicomonas sp. 8E]
MAIKQLNKITLYGPGEDKTRILQGLQTLGCMHLIPLSDNTVDQSLRMQPAQASEAIAWLERSPRIRRQLKDKNHVCIDQVVAEVLDNKASVREVSDARDKLVERIREVRQWGEFSLPSLSDLNGQRFWFYVVPIGEMEALSEVLKENDLPWEEIHRDHRQAYVIVISTSEPAEDLLPVPRSHVGMVPLSRLEMELEESEHLLEEQLAEREALTRWHYLLGQTVAARQDQAALEEASSGTQDEGTFFLVQGWVAVSEKKAVEAFCLENGVAAILEEPSEEDNPPTLLDKSDSIGGGSDALGFFQTPNYRTWDPGNLVFYSFSLFFAMIMSDAMYSLLFGGIVFMFRKNLKKTEAGSRLMNLAYFMSAAGVVWGVLIGSYFGVAPESAGILGHLAVVDLNDYSAMMKLSVFVGVTHLIIANIMTAVVNRGSSHALAPVGWAIIMASGLSMWLGTTDTLPTVFADKVGPAGLIAGALLVFLFTSTRPVRSIGSLCLRGLDGLKGIYNITSAFGDVLSYMRLFALGLSGASLAMTFNTLAMDALDSSPVIGVLFSGLILLLGHILNFALCIMSGVVHGMRLNVIEFVNWGLSDEGYPFKSFRKQED